MILKSNENGFIMYYVKKKSIELFTPNWRCTYYFVLSYRGLFFLFKIMFKQLHNVLYTSVKYLYI